MIRTVFATKAKIKSKTQAHQDITKESNRFDRRVPRKSVKVAVCHLTASRHGPRGVTQSMLGGKMARARLG